MLGLLGGDRDPIVEKRARQSGVAEPRDPEPRDKVPGEIDRVQLDMRQRVQQRDPSRRRAEIAPLRHVARRTQTGTERPRRARRRIGVAHRQDRRRRHARATARLSATFVVGFGRGEDGDGALAASV